MSTVTYLYNAGRGRGPAWLWVSPEQLEVDDGVFRGTLYEFFEDGRPGLRTDALVHLVEHFLRIDRVVPIFLR